MSDAIESSKGVAAADRTGPTVPLPPGGPPIVVIVGGCAVVGVGLFLFLNGHRNRPTPPPTTTASYAVSQLPAFAPALAIPAPPPPEPPPPPPQPIIKYVDRPGPAPPPVIRYIERPAPMPAPAPPPPMTVQARSTDPALVIDLSPADGQKQDDAVRAEVLRHRDMVIAQGTILPAVLETPIDSTAPGPARAIVSRDIYGFDGRRVLIPKGSRLYGEYQSETHVGQARAMVNWTTLVTPQGISVRLSSPGADARGEPGIPGRVNSHFLPRVGAAVLQTALVVGGELAARPGPGSVVVGAPVSGLSQAGATLIPTPPGPTILVAQGADISILVARDLDFSGSLPRQ